MNMKKIISFFIVACCAMCATAAKVVWQIGVADNSGTELALGPSEYKKFLAHDFGYEDRYFLVGTSVYNPQIQISAESETKRSIFREKDKTKRSKKESAQHSKSRNKSFVMTSVSAL